MASRRSAVCLALLCLTSQVSADFRSHSYQLKDEVPVYVNTVSPYRNPTETYGYYDYLPVCRPKILEHRIETLGEVLEGNKLVTSGYDVHFLEPMEKAEVCSQKMDLDSVEKLKHVINEDFHFHLLLDDMPLWGFIGTVDENGEPYLLTNLAFVIEYNGDRIVRANLTGLENHENFTPLKSMVNQEVTFTYSVAWVENKNIPFEDRMKYLSSALHEYPEFEIHWLSIVNSVVLVILLTSFLAIILMRVLRNDYSRYARADAENDDAEAEDFGWKLIHGDVFRFPNHRMLLSALLGVGAQFFILACMVLLLGGIGFYYPHNRGSMKTSGVVIYALTSLIAGYISASFFKQLGGVKWVWNLVLTLVLLPAPLILVWSVLNTIAWVKHSTQALPFGTIIALLSIWLLVGLPLIVFGGITGKNRAGQFEAPCRVRNIPREIPEAPWYHSAFTQFVVAGFLSFSSISIELFYIFSTIWGYKVYTLYWILLIVFIIAVIVTSFICIALVYFQLSVEDYRWWWRSVFNGGASAFFIYGYAIFFYIYKSAMSGVLQGAFFFGYMLVICFAYFLMMGSVGFWSALLFVKYMYRNFKAD